MNNEIEQTTEMLNNLAALMKRIESAVEHTESLVRKQNGCQNLKEWQKAALYKMLYNDGMRIDRADYLIKNRIE